MTTVSMGSHVIHCEDDVPSDVDPSRDPVLMVHSLGGNSWFWKEWVPVLGERRRVVRLDMRGVNGSTLPREGYEYRINDLVDDYIGLLDALGIARVHHVGIATGAILGVVLAARHPDRFSSLTLMSAAPHTGRTVSRLGEITSTLGKGGDDPSGPVTAADTMRRLGLREWYLQTGRGLGDTFGDERDARYADEFAKTPLETIIAMWEGTHHPEVDLTDAVPLVQAPTLLLYGENNATTTLAEQEWIARTMRDARLKTFPGWGSRMWYHHADVLSRETSEFIKDVEGRR